MAIVLGPNRYGKAEIRLMKVDRTTDRHVLHDLTVDVALAGDIHSNWVNDLRVDDREMDAPVVATEFVGTSITSGGDGQAMNASGERTTTRTP